MNAVGEGGDGERLDVTIAGNQIRIDAVAFAADVPYLLMFQDNPSREGGHSAEGARTLALMRDSFRLAR